MMSGWSPEACADLEAAVQLVLAQNPVFTGKLVADQEGLQVVPHMHADLFRVMEGPGDYVAPSTALKSGLYARGSGPLFHGVDERVRAAGERFAFI